MAEIRIDRRILKEIVKAIPRPGGENEWCVACGAGKGSSKLDFPEEVVRESGKQFLDPKALRDFLATIKEAGGEGAWCVACGASAATSPLERVVFPPDISDAFIDQLAEKLIGAVKVE